MTANEEGKHTPLYSEHVAAGGRMVEFAGFTLPVQYTSLVAEHWAVRTAAGLFDVSHMGEVFIRGDNAADFVQRVLPVEAHHVVTCEIIGPHGIDVVHAGGTVGELPLE